MCTNYLKNWIKTSRNDCIHINGLTRFDYHILYSKMYTILLIFVAVSIIFLFAVSYPENVWKMQDTAFASTGGNGTRFGGGDSGETEACWRLAATLGNEHTNTLVRLWVVQANADHRRRGMLWQHSMHIQK